jgi:hypothetical protein
VATSLIRELLQAQKETRTASKNQEYRPIVNASQFVVKNLNEINIIE